MKQSLTLFFFFTSILITCSQNYYVEKLKGADPKFPDEVNEFPILKGGNTTVAKKVNSYLVKDHLDIEWGKQKLSLFENIWRQEDQGMPMRGDLTYKTELLNKKLYCVTISGEGCGAYCEGYDQTYNFDLESGNYLPLDTLFTKQGQKDLLVTINAEKKRIIDNKIKEIKSDLAQDSIKPEEKERETEMLEMYQNCNTGIETLDYLRYIPAKENIKIIAGRCSVHYNRALDDLWEFEIMINIKEWTTQLSEEGKWILN